MGMQGGTNGLVGAMMYEFPTFDGQTVISGLDLRGYPFRYTPGENSLHVLYNGRELSWDEYTATDGATITFPKPLTAGGRIKCWAVGTFNVADTFGRAEADARFNRRRNRFIDPGFRNSQENGSNVVPATTNGAVYYVTDNCAIARSTGAGMFTGQQVKSYTPGGSGYRVRITCTTANPNPGATDQAAVFFPIEGRDIADMRFGTNSGKVLLKRIGLNSSVAGDVHLAVRNRTVTRSWVGKVNIAPGEVGKDVLKWVWFTCDSSGTWDDDNNLGLTLTVHICTGSNFQAPLDGWNAGSYYGRAGAINFMAAVGMTLDIFDVGSHDVTDIANPAPPRFEMKSFGEDLRDCQRYWAKTYRPDDLPGTVTGTNSLWKITEASTNYTNFNWDFPTEMRANSNILIYSPGTGAVNNIRDENNSADRPAGVSRIGTKRAGIFVNNVNVVAGSNMSAHATANARMI